MHSNDGCAAFFLFADDLPAFTLFVAISLSFAVIGRHGAFKSTNTVGYCRSHM